MDTMIIYKNHIEMMDILLKDDDAAWKEAMKGLLQYGFDGVVPTSKNPLVQSVYYAAIPLILKSRDKYIQKCNDTQN